MLLPADGRMADAVGEAERVAQVRRHVHVLPPDGHDAGQIAQGVAGMVVGGLQVVIGLREADHDEMDVRRPERLLPLLWGVLPHVPQVGRAGGHALLELGREAGQRVLRHPERLEALVAEGHPERHRRVGIERRRRVEIRDQAAQQLAPRVPVVDAHDLVGAGVGGRPGHQRPGLDVVQLQRLGRWGGHGCFGSHDATAPGINALTSTGNGPGVGAAR